MSRVHLILTGFMACGKSTLGPLLARDLSLPFVDADSIFRERFGLLAGQYIVRFGVEPFRKQEARLLQEIVEAKLATVIATGGGAPLIARSRALMKERGFVVWLDVPPNVLLQRMYSGDRPPYPKPVSFEAMMEMLETRAPSYAQADLHVKNLEMKTSLETIKRNYLGRFLGRDPFQETI